MQNKGGQSVAMHSLAGTTLFMAPEQTELQDGKFKYSKKIDVFSLAVTWLTLLEACKGSTMMAKTGNYNSSLPSSSFPTPVFHCTVHFSMPL